MKIQTKLRLLVTSIIAVASLPLQAEDQNKAFFEAIRAGNLSLIEALLNQGEDANQYESANPLHPTALSVASKYGNLSIVDLLLNRGANPNKFNNGGHSNSLGAAAFEGHLLIMQKLIKHGAQVNLLSHYRHTPLHIATYGNQPQAIRLLASEGAHIADPCTTKDCLPWYDTPIEIATSLGYPESLRTLLELGTTVNDDLLAQITDKFEQSHPEIVNLAKQNKN